LKMGLVDLLAHFLLTREFKRNAARSVQTFYYRRVRIRYGELYFYFNPN
jgi:hypothetical protein